MVITHSALPLAHRARKPAQRSAHLDCSGSGAERESGESPIGQRESTEEELKLFGRPLVHRWPKSLEKVMSPFNLMVPPCCIKFKRSVSKTDFSASCIPDSTTGRK